VKTDRTVLTTATVGARGAEFVQRLLDKWDPVARGYFDPPLLAKRNRHD
jgi:hypothetical protein